MSNNKQSSSIDFFWNQLPEILPFTVDTETAVKLWGAFEQAKAMQQEQAQLYATFVLKCVQNNLPPITFNDWINLENNEQSTTT
jgi:hypothetical protein